MAVAPPRMSTRSSSRCDFCARASVVKSLTSAVTKPTAASWPSGSSPRRAAAKLMSAVLVFWKRLDRLGIYERGGRGGGSPVDKTGWLSGVIFFLKGLLKHAATVFQERKRERVSERGEGRKKESLKVHPSPPKKKSFIFHFPVSWETPCNVISLQHCNAALCPRFATHSRCFLGPCVFG